MTPIPSQASRLSGSPSRWPHVASLAVLLAAFWSTATPVAHAQEVPVSWAEAWGVSVSGDGLTKVAPLGWNASAVSTKSLVAGDGHLAFTVGVTADLVCGLTTQAASQGYERIDFGIRLASDGTAGVVESGLVRTSGSPYLPGDGFRVAVEDGVVRFCQNGALLYSSTKPPSYPLSASASLHTPGAEISTAALSGSLLENVFWTNGVNVTVVGSDLSKSGGAANTWNAGAVSTRGIVSMDGYVEWVASETTTNRMAGLSSGDTNAGYQDIGFALYLSGSSLYVYEGGVNRGSVGSYATGDVLRVSVEGGVVKYRKNGALLRTSAVAPVYPLLVDSSLYALGATLKGAVLSGELVDVALAPPVFSVPTGHYPTAQAVVVTSPDPLATIHYTTNGVDPTEADAEIASGGSVLISQDTVLKARSWRSGLIRSSVTSAMYTLGPVVTEPVVWTNGVNVTVAGSDLSKGGGAANSWDAGAVSTRGIVSPDGYVEWVASETTTNRMAGLSTGDTNAGYPDIDFALYLSGSSLYVYESGVNRGSVGSYATGDALRVSVEGGVVKYRKNGALLRTSAVAPVYPLLVDSSLYALGATLRGAVLSGKLVDVALAPPVFSVPTGHYPTAQTVVVTSPDPLATIHYTTDGVDPTEADAEIASGGSVLISQDTVLKARSWRSGLIRSGVTSATYTLGPVVTEPVVWTNGVNVTVAGSDLSKSGGAANTWNAGAVSTRGIVSPDGYVEWVASETTTNRMAGLSSGDTNAGYQDIDFALYLSGSSLYVYEGGVNRGSVGSYATGDVLRVSVEGGVVKYRKNGALLRTSAVAPVFPLLVDSSLYALGATLRGAVLSGELVDVALAPPVFSVPTGHYPTAQTVVVTSPDPLATIHYTTNGVDPTEADAELASGGSVFISQDTVLKARSWRSGLIRSGVTSAMYTFGPVVTEPVVWTNGVNVTVAGSDLSKGGGAANSWDAGAVSTRGIVSPDGYVEWVASETTTNRMAGLSSGDTNAGYPDIDFALYLSGSSLYVYEGGVNRGSVGSYATGDVLRVSVEGGVVKYRKNGALLRTSAVAPVFPLLVDSSLYALGATLRGAVLSGKLVDVALTPPVVSVTGVTIAEGNGGTTNAGFAVTLSAMISGTVTVDYATADGTATAGSDYTSASGTLTFAPGETSKTITVLVTGDTAVEVDETFTVALSGASGATIATATATGTIANDDLPALSIAGVTVSEGNSETTNADFEVMLSPAAPFAVTVGYATADGTATAGSDYASASGILTFAPGETSKTITVLVAGDTTVEADETFTVTLSGASGATIGAATATGTIADDEIMVATPVIAPNGGTYSGVKSVAVTTTTPGATIRYTLTGAEPTEADTAVGGTGTVLLAATATLKAKAFMTGLAPSEAASADFVFERPGGVSAGGSHSVALTPDGTVWAWGDNTYYQLGVGSSVSESTVPVQTGGVSDAVAIAAGVLHTLALKADGRVVAWGHNSNGQLGNGSVADRLLAVEVQTAPGQALAGVVAIAAGAYHSLALTADGKVWAWGANNYGQLGDGTTTQGTRPTVVPGVEGVIGIGAGDQHSFAVVAADRSVWTWGDNNYAQLGDGTKTRRLSPVAVVGMIGTEAVTGGTRSSLAFCIDGFARAWGANSYGQLGDGTKEQRTVPVRVVNLPNVGAMAAGGYYSLALANGEIRAWGRNNSGQLGDGTTTERLLPAIVPGLSEIAGIGAGNETSLAVSSDGTVFTWGSGTDGLLGDGTAGGYRATPAAISGPGFAWRVGMPVPSVAAGTYSTAQTVTLTTVTSGASIHYSTDGGEPTTPYTGPISITQTTLLKARATKDGQPESNVTSALYTLKPTAPTFSPVGGTYSVDPTVTMSCPPTSCASQGMTIRYTTDGVTEPGVSSLEYTGPVLVSQTTTVKAKVFKAGWEPSGTTTATYTLARGALPAPTLSPAGGTYPGSLAVEMSSVPGATIRYTANGAEPGTSSPIYASPVVLAVTTTIKAKAYHPEWTVSPTAATTYTIKVADVPTISLASGEYPIGQPVTMTIADPQAMIAYTLDGSTPTASSPVVPSGTTVYLMKPLTLTAAGMKSGCELGDVATAAYTVTGTVPAVTVTGGAAYSLLAKSDGSVWAWGHNAYGQLGDTTLTQRTLPVLSSASGIVGLDAGANHAAALASDGRVWTWGYNNYGQLGDGTTTSPQPTPEPLSSPSGVLAVSAGDSHTLAAKSGGTVSAWGYNNKGQLGDGTTTTQRSPVDVMASAGVPLADVVDASAGTSHSLAIKTDGHVWAWGANNYGQLGDGTTTTAPVVYPVEVRRESSSGPALEGVVAAAGGGSHSLAATSDGAVWAWGYNYYGQLGDGTGSQRTTPVRVSGLTGGVAVAGGEYYSLALLSDGTLWSWGYNGYGQLGDGTQTSRSLPVRVAIPAPVVAAAAGANHALAVSLDGTIWAWGRNSNGQLGLGTTFTPLPTPTRITDSAYSWRVAMPTFTPGAGGYSAAQAVVLSSATTGATICYSTDGSDPSGCVSSVPSGGSVPVAVSLTLRAIATKAGLPTSSEAQAVYTLNLPAPTFSSAPGTYYTDLALTMTPPAGATVRYTTDGTEPSDTNGDDYTAPVPVTRTQTVRARAFRTGWTASSIVGGTYTMTVASPTLSPAGGSYDTSQVVAFATTTPGAPVHYTTDGREPTNNDPVGTSVVVDQSMTVKVKGFREGWTTSATVVGAYFLSVGSATAPTMDPPGGSYTTPQLVVLRSATTGARIRYTTDGTDPTLFSQAYRAPILVDETVTLKAKAFAGDMGSSTTTTEAYTVAAPAVVAPVFSPASGPFATARPVTVTCATAGATIHYTTDGTDPTQEDPTVASGQTVLVDRSMTLRARAWNGSLESAVRAGQYHVTGAVSTGTSHSLALRSDSHVMAWGTNSSGQLGDGTNTGRDSPVEVQAAAGVPLADVVAIHGGNNHSLAVGTSGHAWAWGNNSYGQLGNGTSTTVPVVYPVEVRRESPTGPALEGVVAVAGGRYHSLALTSDGSVWAWGYNSNGQLGDGSATTRPYAVQVVRAADSQALDGVVAVAAGARHSIALRSDGTVWGWGYGQGVDGSTSSLNKAVQVSGLAGIVSIAAGLDFTVAGRVDGAVWAWGVNNVGQLGHGSTVTMTRPARAGSIAGVAEVAAGTEGKHVDALVPGPTGDQTLWAWGAAGQVGESEASPTQNRLWPGRVVGMVDAVAVSAGSKHTILLQGDATVWTWGVGAGTALGHAVGYPVYESSPAPVPAFTLADASWVMADADGDGLPTGFEWRLGTDPLNADTNGDGTPDGAAVSEGEDPNDVDTDGDGIRNSVEVARGTDPLRADTDGDGVGDAQDCFPLDPTRSECIPPDPEDHTPPLISLTEPTTAVLISSLP